MSIDLSLDRLQRLVRYLPAYTRPTCHIAGTNGKGSVSSIITSILHESSISFGRYNSPHLVSICDCIVINNQPVDAAVYTKARASVEDADKRHNTELSNFEILTLTALIIFEEALVDIAVIEVGMGGRLDATNIIPDESIVVSALTAVDLDHQFFLGNTVADIAKEKAGIARRGKPFVLGPQKHADVESVVMAIVDRVGGDLTKTLSVAKRSWDEEIDGQQGPEFSLKPFEKPRPQPITIHFPCFDQVVHALLPLYGEHQLDNVGISASVVSLLLSHPSCERLHLVNRITPETVSKGIKAVRWPGRLSFHTIPTSGSNTVVLADGAHNEASSTTLGAYITDLLAQSAQTTPVTLTYILSLSHSPPKTPLQTLSPILPPVSSVRPYHVNVACLSFTPPAGMPWVKSVEPEELRTVAKALVPEAEIWLSDKKAPDQLARALEWAAEKGGKGDELVIIAGSLYLVADFYRLLAKS